MNYYCWSCYTVNKMAQGRCCGCGGDIAEPEGTSFVDRLLWELGHPLPDRQLFAAEVLGKRGEVRARHALRNLAEMSADPYLAAQALDSLIAIDGARQHRPLLEDLARRGAVPVRAVATGALKSLR